MRQSQYLSATSEKILLAQSGNMDAYCHYISQSSNDTAMEWLQNNSSKTEQLEAWLKENQAHLQ